METILSKSDILAQEDKLCKAMIAGDITRLEELLHNDLLFIIPSGQAINKEIDLNTYRDGALKVKKITPVIETLNLIGDTAIVILSMDLSGSYQGETFEGKYRYIRIWKKFESGIKVIGGSGIAI